MKTLKPGKVEQRKFVDVFARNVRTKREALRMSVVDLADAAGCYENTIYSTESGRATPRLETAISIARALECTVDELCEADKLTRIEKLENMTQVQARKIQDLTQENRKLAQALAALTMERVQ